MRRITLMFLISIATLSFSQTRHIKVNYSLLDISEDKIEIKLNSQVENLDHCSIQILDSAKNVVKTGDFPKAIQKSSIKQWTENSFSISDLAPGKYTLLIYLGKEEMIRRSFSKNGVKAKN